MRLALLACLLLLAAIAGWAMFGLGVEPPAPSDGGAANRSKPVASLAQQDRGGRGAEVVGNANERAIAGPVGDASSLQVPADATWIEVLIVDAKTDKPVPGADVWWSNHVQKQHVRTLTPERREFHANHVLEQVTEFGFRARSDELGIVRISPGNDGALVLARHGARLGLDHFSESAGEASEAHFLKIVDDVTLQVLVRDAEGEPAPEVPLRVSEHFVSTGNTRDLRAFFGADGLTDHHGLATIRELGRWQKSVVGDDRGKPIDEWTVVARIPEMAHPLTLVDAQNPPAEPVELQLGPTGQLRVRLLCAGRPLPAPRMVALGSPIPAGQSGPTIAATVWQRSVDAAGWIDWPYVPLGKTFRLSGRRWSMNVAGPVAANEVREHTIELTQHLDVIVGRLLDAGGAAIAREKVRLEATLHVTQKDGTESEDHGYEHLWTDSHGSFVWLRDRGATTSKLRIVEGYAKYRSLGGGDWLAHLPEREVQNGRTDLGAIRVSPGDLVVAGQVHYDQPGFHPSHLFVEKRDEAGGWQRVSGLSQTITKDHAFEFRGMVGVGRYRLVLRERRTFPVTPQEFALGTRELQVNVRCGHSLHAAVLMPEVPRGFRLEFHLIPDPGQPTKVKRKRADDYGGTHGRYQFRWEALEAGSYSLQVRSEAMQAPLFSLDNVQIPLPADDHRLHELDLREHVHSLVIDLQLRQHVVPLAFLLPQEGNVWRAHELRAGKQALGVAPGPVTLMVAAKGHVPVIVPDVQGTVQITLQPRPVAELQFVHSTRLPEGFELRVAAQSLTPAAPDARRYQTAWAEGSMGELLHHQKRFEAVAGDRHDLVLADGGNRLFVTVHAAKGERALTRVSPAQLSAGGQYQISLSDEELAGAIEELRED